MSNARLLLGSTAAALAVAVVPAAASAATVATDASCYLTGSDMGVAGQGFAAGAPVSVESTGLFGSAPADAAGAFTLATKAPLLSVVTPAAQDFTLTASDGTNTAQVGFRVTNFAHSLSPSSPPRPQTKVRWRFSGFAPSAQVWAHYVHGGHQVTRRSFGKMPAVCGVLSKKIALIPIAHPAEGRWRIQIDTRKSYSAKTPVKFVETGSVTRRIF